MRAVGGAPVRANNFTNVVADADDDDWDKDDNAASHKVNQRESNGSFFNRAPLNTNQAATQNRPANR